LPRAQNFRNPSRPNSRSMRHLFRVGLLGLMLTQGGRASAHTTVIAPSRFDGALSVLDRLLVRDLSDGRLDEYPLVRACLIAGGASTAREMERDLDRWHLVQQPLVDQVASPAELFARLQRDLLHRYVHDSDSLQAVLRTGEFNCMSASVAYLALCEGAGFSAHARATRGHVRVHVDEYPGQDVETTSPTWQTAIVPATSPPLDADSTWRALSPAQLVARLYFNRATRAIQAAQWSRAIECIHVACQLDPSDASAAANRVAAYNAWAQEYAERGDRTRSRSLIDEALQWSPNEPALLLNRQRLVP